MATKTIIYCDRCKLPITIKSEVKVKEKTYELCKSCSDRIEKFLKEHDESGNTPMIFN